MKAETASSTPALSAVTTPDTASIAEPTPSEGQGSGDETETETETTTAVSEGTATASKHKRSASEGSGSTSTKIPEKASEGSGKGGNLVGKLNNLVTTDLNNIVDGRDFMFFGECDSSGRSKLLLICEPIVMYIPFQICLCIWFLYRILGWSAFMGMLVIIVILPLPGYIAKLVQGVQVTKMKKVRPVLPMKIVSRLKCFWQTDARVQNVTECAHSIEYVLIRSLTHVS